MSFGALIFLVVWLFGEALSTFADIQYTPHGMFSSLLISLNPHSLCKVNVVVPKSHIFYTWNIDTPCEFKAVGDGGLGEPLLSRDELSKDRAPHKEINFTCFKGKNSILVPLAERYNLSDPPEKIEAQVVVNTFCDGHEEHAVISLETVEPIVEYIPRLRPTLALTGALIFIGFIAVLYSVFLKKHI